MPLYNAVVDLSHQRLPFVNLVQCQLHRPTETYGSMMIQLMPEKGPAPRRIASTREAGTQPSMFQSKDTVVSQGNRAERC